MSDNAHLATLFPAICDQKLEAFRQNLHRLRANPPQVLLFEGGLEAERRDMAKYWAATCLCEAQDAPCLACPICERVADESHFDIMAYDGAVAQKEDEANPGFYRAFSAENARNIRVRLRDSPKGRYRVVFFTGIALSRPEAPNALLKILEEPSQTALFVLLVPARGQILPTLVSRSHCLTLPWPDPLAQKLPEGEELAKRFAQFFSNQGGFLSHITGKSALTQSQAQAFFTVCRQSIIRALAGCSETALDQVFAKCSPQLLQNSVVWIQEATSMLSVQLNPARVVEAFAMRLYTSLS